MSWELKVITMSGDSINVVFKFFLSFHYESPVCEKYGVLFIFSSSGRLKFKVICRFKEKTLKRTINARDTNC